LFFKPDKIVNRAIPFLQGEHKQSSIELSDASFWAGKENAHQKSQQGHQRSNGIITDTSDSSFKSVHTHYKRFDLHEGNDGDDNEDHLKTDDTQVIDDHISTKWEDKLEPMFANEIDLE